MEPARLTATDLACRRGDRLLFRGLSFELREGQALQVVGPNGTARRACCASSPACCGPRSGRSMSRRGPCSTDRLPLDDNLPLVGRLSLASHRRRRLRPCQLAASVSTRSPMSRSASSRPASASASPSNSRTRGSRPSGCSTSRSTGSTRAARRSCKKKWRRR